ncbi:PH domain-containing protein [Pistricoccus aurantiacus]|uniref:PH domain-containing protein n=1 Tax=Pistricoccus aurantiacus TaxID=1883414 RepID=A0A5B8SQP1_9GAMM|nr:PH domain-containing protein [Pistricoccus aurantiacus]QEA38621.1 PH domain-containing protein [Pistricoccus aurantiacus]
MDPNLIDQDAGRPIAEETSLATLRPSARVVIPSVAWWLSIALGVTGLALTVVFNRPGLVQRVEDSVGAALPEFGWVWLLGGVWLASLAFPLYQLLVLKTTTYHLTSQRLEYTRGILNRRRDQIELARIRDLTTSRTLMNRLLGIGTVILDTVDRSHPVFRIEAQRDVYALSDWLHQLNVEERTRLGYREYEGTQGV